MSKKIRKQSSFRGLVYGLALLGAAGASGCQVDVAGQTLPSAYWHNDDVQYFPRGPNMKVAKEAAAQAEYKAELAAENARRTVPSRLRNSTY